MDKIESRMEELGNRVASLEVLKDKDPAGSWGKWLATTGDLSVAGTKTLYYGVFLREYDADGNLVAAGSETIPVPEGWSLRPTWDIGRWI